MQLRTEERDAFLSDVEMLCEMLDKNAERNALYVRWLHADLCADDGALLKQCAERAREMQERAGLGDIMAQTPLEVPSAMAQLAASVSTFFAAHETAPPAAVVDLVVGGCVLPSLDLRRRGREAMGDEVLEIVDTNLVIATHTLLSYSRAAASHGVDAPPSTRLTQDLQTATQELLAVLNDVHEETVQPAIMLVVLLDTLIPAAGLYASVRVHADANKFGVDLVSLINRGLFPQFSGAHDGLVDVMFVERALAVEGAEGAEPSPVFFPSDLGVFAEILEREIRDAASLDEDDSARCVGYRRLLKAVALHPLRPETCTADLDAYAELTLDEA